MDAREHNVEPAFQHTCTWIRDHVVYKEWFEQSNGLLWISGKPGSGKSTLMKQAMKYARDGVTKGSPIASFFFHSRSGLPLEGTSLGMFRALLCQLLEQKQSQEPFEQFLDKFLKKKARHAKTDWQWQLSELKSSFHAIITHPTSPHTYLYIDALDECSDSEARELAGFFQQMVTESKRLHICVSTRHTSHLSPELRCRIYLENENTKDIATYVQEKLRFILIKSQKLDLSNMLMRKASGVFLWVDLVLKMLMSALDMGATEAELKETLDAIPEELEELYRAILGKIPKPQWHAARQLMQWVLYAERPLTTTELRYAIGFSKQPPSHSIAILKASSDYIGKDEQMEKRIMGLTRGLMEVGNFTRASRVGRPKRYGREGGQIRPLGVSTKKVQFIHQSVKDFLLKDNILGYGHEMLMKSCIAYLATPEVQHSAIVAPGDEFESLFEEQSTLTSWPSYTVSFLNYAVNMCFMHAQKAEHIEKVATAPFLVQFYAPSDILFKRWRELYDQYRIRVPRDQQGRETTFLHVAAEFRLVSLARLLLGNSFSVDVVGGKHGTALQTATFLGYDDVVNILIEHSADVNLHGKENSTALYCAAQGGHVGTVRLLLQHGARIGEIAGPDGTALQAALHEGHIDVVKLLVQTGANLKQRVHEDQTPLLWSLQVGCTISSRRYIPLEMQQDLENKHVTVIQYMLAQNADLEAVDCRGRTALLITVFERRVSLVRLLIAYGAKVNVKERTYGWTPLILAAMTGAVPIVQILLEEEIDLEAQDHECQTALLRAASGGHMSVVKMLVERGAKLEVNNIVLGHCAALGAASREHMSIVKMSTKLGGKSEVDNDILGHCAALEAAAASGFLEVTTYLLDAGALLEHKSYIGSTALLAASAAGHSTIVEFLLARGADINTTNTEGETPLLATVKAQSHLIKQMALLAIGASDERDARRTSRASTLLHKLKRTVVLLLSHKADISIEDKFGGTAIYYAASGGQVATTRFLLKYGAKVEDINSATRVSPLQVAQQNGHYIVARLLIRSSPELERKQPQAFARRDSTIVLLDLLSVEDNGDNFYEIVSKTFIQPDVSGISLLLTSLLDQFYVVDARRALHEPVDSSLSAKAWMRQARQAFMPEELSSLPEGPYYVGGDAIYPLLSLDRQPLVNSDEGTATAAGHGTEENIGQIETGIANQAYTSVFNYTQPKLTLLSGLSADSKDEAELTIPTTNSPIDAADVDPFLNLNTRTLHQRLENGKTGAIRSTFLIGARYVGKSSLINRIVS